MNTLIEKVLTDKNVRNQASLDALVTRLAEVGSPWA
jgi:hypothetical protein